MVKRTVTLLASVLLISMLLPGGATAQTSTQLVLGIDHIPVVVADLEKAEADFRAMGFSIKPGRPHANGIRNAHVKFPDGTEIELITAPAAVDTLTAEYRAKLKGGDGPVYFGLYTPDSTTLATKLSASGVAVRNDDGLLDFLPASPLHPLFFGGRTKSSTDKPEHFAHANSALRLSAVWIRDNKELRTLLRGLGMTLTAVSQCAPIYASEGSVAMLPEGKVYLVPSLSKSVIAVRVEVRSLATFESVLKKNKVPIRRGILCDASAVWISPVSAHGIWLEFVGSQK